MSYNYREMRVISVDPRFVQKIQRSAQMTAEQGLGFLQGWGGTAQYGRLAGMPMEERLVYAATLEGNTTTSEIEVVTGLTPTQVSKGLISLQKQGVIALEPEKIPV